MKAAALLLIAAAPAFAAGGEFFDDFSHCGRVVLRYLSATGTQVDEVKGPKFCPRDNGFYKDAQTLAAALNHSALNIGNATGAWVGGLVIAAGFGYTAPAAAGAVLAASGITVLTVSVALQRRGRRVLA